MKTISIGYPMKYEDDKGIIRTGLWLKEKEVELLEKTLEKANKSNKIIDITKNNIDITMQIIREQPTVNDEWILERLYGIREVMNK